MLCPSEYQIKYFGEYLQDNIELIGQNVHCCIHYENAETIMAPRLMHLMLDIKLIQNKLMHNNLFKYYQL